MQALVDTDKCVTHLRNIEGNSSVNYDKFVRKVRNDHNTCFCEDLGQQMPGLLKDLSALHPQRYRVHHQPHRCRRGQPVETGGATWNLAAPGGASA